MGQYFPYICDLFNFGINMKTMTNEKSNSIYTEIRYYSNTKSNH